MKRLNKILAPKNYIFAYNFKSWPAIQLLIFLWFLNENNVYKIIALLTKENT